MAEEVKIQFTQTGAQEVTRSVEGLKQQIEDFKKRMEGAGMVDPFKAFHEGAAKIHASRVQDQVKQTIEGFKEAQSILSKPIGGGFTEGLSNLSAQLKAGGAESGLFSAGLDTVSQGLKLFSGAGGPITLAASGIAAFVHELKAAAQASQETFMQVRNLQAMMGGTPAQAQALTHALESMGVDGDKAGLAFFRLGAQIENGGKELQKMGISIRDSGGELKEEGDIFLEVAEKIGGMKDASSANAAALALFGRQGRSLIPILRQGGGAIREQMELMKEHATATQAFMDESLKLVKTQAELKRTTEEYNNVLALMYGYKLEEKINSWRTAWVHFKEALMTTPANLMAKLFGGVSVQEVTEMEKAADQQQKLMEQAMKVADQKKFQREGRLTDPEAAAAIEKVNADFEINQRRLKGETQFEAERLKIQTGATSSGLALELTTNEQLVRAENERYEKVLALKRRTLLDPKTGQLPPQEMEKLEKEHQDRLLNAEMEGNKLRLQQQVAFAQEYGKALDQRMKQEEAATQKQAAIQQTFYTAQKAAISLFAQNQIETMQQTYQTDIQNVQEVTRTKVDQINRQMDAEREYAAKFPDNFEVQQRTQAKILELGNQRVAVEQQTNQKMIESRKAYLAQVQAMAEKEASIGESLEQKAIARLQKRGRHKITAADIAAEESKMGEEARGTHAAFATGGAVSIEKLQESRQYGHQLAQLQQIGGTAAGARGAFEAQQGAAYAGQAFRGIPSGMAGEAGNIASMTASIGTEAGRSMEEIGKALSSFMKTLPDMFMDKVIRKLELEAARN